MKHTGIFFERAEREREEAIRMAIIERQREAQLIQEAEHYRDGLRPAEEFRPLGEIVIPPRLIGRPPEQIPDQAGRRHPNSAICQIVELWRQGRI